MVTESVTYKWDHTGVSFKKGGEYKAWALQWFWSWHTMKSYILYLKDKIMFASEVAGCKGLVGKKHALFSL